MKIEMRQIDSDAYESEHGHTLRREGGESPDGIPFRSRWVFRNPEGKYIDHDQYRNDLAEEYHLNLRSARIGDNFPPKSQLSH